MDDADAHTFILNYIVVASLFLLAGVILTLVKERQLNRPGQRLWRKCIYGHWGIGREYCTECGLWLAPVSQAQQKRIEYVASHNTTRQAIRDRVMRYCFALWLLEKEQADDFQYMLDVALVWYRCNWQLHAQEVVGEH